MKYGNMREEEIKNRIAKDYFYLLDTNKIIGNIDFCVASHQKGDQLFEQPSLLWAEAKKDAADPYKSLTQLILTIGKARTFDKFLPPPMLAAFDAEKIAFILYSEVSDIFYINDFNWNVAPSNYETREFKLIFDKVKSIIDEKSLIFNYERDNKELVKFIKANLQDRINYAITKNQIDKNNFMVVYNKWLIEVKPTIALNWEIAKKNGLIDGDFYLADLLSQENLTLKDKLYVLLRVDHYELGRKLEESGLFSSSSAQFTDNRKAHTQFWNKYHRPPKEGYWDYIIERRDLLVPQDVRERKGSFFTPQIWVELSQKYIADVLGEDWQDEYYVWDCAAGTGNLLAGLTNKYNIWASTLDQQDVDVMHDRIGNGANLLKDHVFQFDFLNDDFSKLPDSLKKIIEDPEKRKKLVIYINPPYAEAGSGVGRNFKDKVATEHTANELYKKKIGNASNELFALFMARIYDKISECFLVQFSKVKFIQGSNFAQFKNYFLAHFLGGFVVPANTFDNVKGDFPIGFTMWDLNQKEKMENIVCHVYDKNENPLGQKIFYGDLPQNLNKWLINFKGSNNNYVGVLVGDAPDYQNNKFVCLQNAKGIRHGLYFIISITNIIQACIYLAVRHCIPATWLNDRDQFLYPNDAWQSDIEFQNDCLAYTLFHGQNRITATEGTNHWIPFTEEEVNSREKFDSNFMSDFLRGKIKKEEELDLFSLNSDGKLLSPLNTLEFSPAATAVFDAGRELWKYYHAQANCDVNASLYDIRAYFQGRNDKGKMNNKSEDEEYNRLIGDLREALNILAKQIEPKVYEYGFLK